MLLCSARTMCVLNPCIAFAQVLPLGTSLPLENTQSYVHCKVDGWKLPLLMHLHAGHVTLALYPGSTPMSDTFSETQSPSILSQSSSWTPCGCVLKNSSPSVRGRTQTSQQATDKQARSHTSKDTVMLSRKHEKLARASFSLCTCVGLTVRC